ncbi:hypothetical protein M2302_002461 [Micromonospora sp. A200]|uniref:hypothetical protein n=1 Tax=Micromonospora sp. A200 TaxID=2940568 RepID=UPI002476625B|nr:hypothetical protein [Micromonospora sp. A200]MDH6462283.1 hypothetical protein [Micromonospora sp. A200]
MPGTDPATGRGKLLPVTARLPRWHPPQLHKSGGDGRELTVVEFVNFAGRHHGQATVTFDLRGDGVSAEQEKNRVN